MCLRMCMSPHICIDMSLKKLIIDVCVAVSAQEKLCWFGRDEFVCAVQRLG